MALISLAAFYVSKKLFYCTTIDARAAAQQELVIPYSIDAFISGIKSVSFTTSAGAKLRV